MRQPLEGSRRSTAPLAAPDPKLVKVVVWDLDNTIWDGTLSEDGPSGIRLQPGMAAVIKELDRRGILQSIVSKNDPEKAVEQLDRFQISDYFLSPKIGWGAKGAYVQQLIQEFNIGADAVVFIDDSEFEREQVAVTNPLVRVFSSTVYTSLLDRPEFNPPATAEAANRRELYRTEMRRAAAHTVFDGDYLDFLKSCNIVLEVAPVCCDNLERVHELIQRTNQLNFSGTRYTREQVAAIVADPRFDHFCVRCTDRFGEYGVVGFGVVERAIPRLRDLAFSCRVQSKRVEHAFLSFLLQEYRESGHSSFEALYHETTRNRPAARVFDDLGFVEATRSGSAVVFRFDLSRAIPFEGIIRVRTESCNDLLSTTAPGSKNTLA
jgi:FkbH-like protein